MNSERRVNWQALMEATIIPPATRFPWEETWHELEDAEWSGLAIPIRRLEPERERVKV